MSQHIPLVQRYNSCRSRSCRKHPLDRYWQCSARGYGFQLDARSIRHVSQSQNYIPRPSDMQRSSGFLSQISCVARCDCNRIGVFLSHKQAVLRVDFSHYPTFANQLSVWHIESLPINAKGHQEALVAPCRVSGDFYLTYLPFLPDFFGCSGISASASASALSFSSSASSSSILASFCAISSVSCAALTSA